ncbi:MAG TPA: histidine kinase dimerization/phospho-acceptor domain-containing protein, partial [Bacilli bacterium]
MSIRLRLTLWYSGILTITLLFFGLTLYLFLYVKMNNDIDFTLKNQGTEVKKEIKLVRIFGLAQIQLPDLRDFRSSGIYLQSININREVSRSSNLTEIIDFSPEAFDKAITLQEDTFETISSNGFELRIYYTPMLVNKQVVGVLQVAAQLNGIQQFLNNLVFILSLLIVLTILIAATVGWFLARKALNPIEYVIAAAGQIEKGADLERRLSYNGPPDEIGRLTDTINGMLSRIQTVYSELSDAYRAQRRFVSDASHELRTPLTTIRGNIELLEKMWNSTKAPREAMNEPDHMGMSLEAMRDISSE